MLKSGWLKRAQHPLLVSLATPYQRGSLEDIFIYIEFNNSLEKIFLLAPFDRGPTNEQGELGGGMLRTLR